MSLLAKIILASLFGGILALIGGIALLFRTTWVRKFAVHFTSFAVGVLLAAAFLDLLPEGLALAGEHFQPVLLMALAGILGMFLLEQLVYKFHPHHHEDTPEHHHPVPVMLMLGDTTHNFIDGVLIAITFLTDPALGVLATLAVFAHELPQEISDFSVMLNHGWGRARVLWMNIISSLASLAGALVAFSARAFIEPFLPQMLGLTGGIFLYIAMADLMADISTEKFRDKTWHVILLVCLGVLSIWILGTLFVEN